MPRRTRTIAEQGERIEKRGNAALFGALFTLGIITTVGVVVWGQSDRGQIDVSATIANSGNTTSEGGDVATPPPTESFQNMPNGGLVPQSGDGTLPTPVPETEGGTQPTTTEEIGTTTPEEVSEDGGGETQSGEPTTSAETEGGEPVQ